jgi:hypothetical protein
MTIPTALVAQASLSLLVVDAAGHWARTDSELVRFYQRASRHNVMMVVDQIEPDLLEPLTGPIKKEPRRWFRPSAKSQPVQAPVS